MIEFRGEISGECRRFLLRRTAKSGFLVSLLTVTIFFIPTIIAAIYWNPVILLFSVVYLLALIFPLIPMSKKDQKKFIPTKIIIDADDECVVLQGENFERFHMFSSIKTVKDYGAFYDFEFYYGDKDMFAICQKSLLSSGTLEEFEALFEGKIERKV